MNKHLFPICLLFWTGLLFAQPTVNQSTYDLRFADETVDCESATPIFCASIQIKSAIEGESFRIGSHTVFFNYNPLSIQSPTYTSTYFNHTNLCIGQTAAYQTPAFNFDANTSEANFTTIAQQALTEQLCPLVTDEWLQMGKVCFEVVNDEQFTNLQFNGNFTTFNYIDPTASNNIGDPQDKAEHTKGTLTGLNVLPICPCNQSIEQAATVVQEFCESGTPDLAAAESEIVFSGDGSVFSIEWFEDENFNTAYEGGNLQHSQTDLCQVESHTLYAKAICMIDNTVSAAGTLTLNLYPEPQTPMIERLDDTCSYQVLSFCENDALSETTFSLPPDTEAATRSIEVSSGIEGNVCEAKTFEVAFEACPELVCSQTIEQNIEVVQSFCESGTADLQLAESELQYSGDGSVFTIEWFEDEIFNTPFEGQVLSHSLANVCEVETVVLYARATCSDDASTIAAGTLTLNLYPEPQAPTIVRIDDACSYQILPFCENDALSETTFNLPPDTEAATRSIEVSSGIEGNVCEAKTFEVAFEACPELVCSQTIEQTIAAVQSFCESGMADLQLAESELQYSGDGSVFTIEWFEDETFNAPFEGQVLSHSLANVCEVEKVVLYARATCSDDASTIAAGTLTVELYPSPQTPIIERLDDACSYQVLPFCENDALSETTFNLPPDTEAATRSIEVSSGIEGNVCEAKTFEVAFEACPELICYQTIEQTIAAVQSFCESGMADLQLAESELQYSGDGSVFAIEWFEDESFSVSFEGQVLSHSLADVCEVETVVLYARATCSDDASTIAAGTLTVELYPSPQAPTIVRLDDACSYQVLPFCENDALSETTFNLPPDTETATRSIEVSSGIEGNVCEAKTFEVAFEACPELVCSQMIEQNIEVVQSFCESGTADLQLAESELQYSGDGSVFTIEWFEDETFNVPFEGQVLSHSLADVCEVETVVLYARATCSDDASTIAAGTLTVELYPSPQAPTIVRLDDACSYQVLPFCENDALSETTFNLPPDTETATRSIEVSSGIEGNVCEAKTFEVAFEACPQPFCNLEVVSAVPSECDSTTNTYSLEVTVTYGLVPNAPIDFVVGGMSQGGGMIDGSGEQTFVLEDLVADGEMDVDIVAGLVIGNICVDTLLNAYDAPVSCESDLCAVLELGELPTDNQFVCFGDVLQVNHFGAVIPDGTALVYVLHTAPSNALSNPLFFSTDGFFDRLEIPEALPNIPYYVTAVGGLDMDENGIPELENNECLKFSNPMPLVFLDEIVIDFDISTNETMQTFDLSLTVGGGLPAFNSSNYQIVLSNGMDTVVNGHLQTVIFENLQLTEALDILATDFVGCVGQVENIAVGIEESLEFLEKFDLQYLPNRFLQLQFWSRQPQDLNLALYDLTGRKLQNRTFSLQKGYTVLEWSLMDLPLGVYLLQVDNGREFFVRKIYGG